MVKLQALFSHRAAPLEHSLWLLTESCKPEDGSYFISCFISCLSDGKRSVQYFAGATLELEAHQERYHGRVKADAGGYGQEAPSTVAGNGSLSVMRKSTFRPISSCCAGIEDLSRERDC